MPRAFTQIAFTPAVRAVQTRLGSRGGYSGLDATPEAHDRLTQVEAAFIEARDSFYQASVSETGWPYVQFRGGARGFLKVLDGQTVGYADFRGNRQYISTGNISADGRVSLILMDYAHQRRLKLWGRARVVEGADAADWLRQLEMPDYRAHVERAVIISVEAYDWNCPQHITPRFTQEEFWAGAGESD